jgi:hypothetical protein
MFTYIDVELSSLEQHAKDRHDKTIADCFPTFKA